MARVNSDKTKKQILSKAKQRLKDQDFPNKDERIRPRENVFISDKSVADSAQALIGVFLGRYEVFQGVKRETGCLVTYLSVNFKFTYCIDLFVSHC